MEYGKTWTGIVSKSWPSFLPTIITFYGKFQWCPRGLRDNNTQLKWLISFRFGSVAFNSRGFQCWTTRPHATQHVISSISTVVGLCLVCRTLLRTCRPTGTHR
jgi:hypothetical protein